VTRYISRFDGLDGKWKGCRQQVAYCKPDTKFTRFERRDHNNTESEHRGMLHIILGATDSPRHDQ
jgi:hypothetical protein